MLPRELVREGLAIREGRQCTFIVTRLCNRCCSGIAISNTYSENVFVALGIQHAMCMRHFDICGLPGFTIFFPHSYLRHDFRKRCY
jgi:hypothetical protein